MIKEGGFHIGDFNYAQSGQRYSLIIAEQRHEIRHSWSENPVEHVTFSRANGLMNTLSMNANNNSKIAKIVLSLNISGYSDWFIPSYFELDFIFQRKNSLPEKFSFNRYLYWTSTSVQHDFNFSAYAVNFDSDFANGNSYLKSNHLNVRPVRKIELT